jgi:uncharacterized coiled-coil protein SlyX
MSTDCPDCGCPVGHNAKCAVAIMESFKERVALRARVEELEGGLNAAHRTVDRLNTLITASEKRLAEAERLLRLWLDTDPLEETAAFLENRGAP